VIKKKEVKKKELKGKEREAPKQPLAALSSSRPSEAAEVADEVSPQKESTEAIVSELPRQSAPYRALEPIKVLVVDDSEVNRDLLLRMTELKRISSRCCP